MSIKNDSLMIDRLDDLFDVEIAFTRIQALSDVLLEYIMNDNGTGDVKLQDNINFTLMTIRDYADFYANQVQNLHIVNGELKPLQAAE